GVAAAARSRSSRVFWSLTPSRWTRSAGSVLFSSTGTGTTDSAARFALGWTWTVRRWTARSPAIRSTCPRSAPLFCMSAPYSPTATAPVGFPPGLSGRAVVSDVGVHVADLVLGSLGRGRNAAEKVLGDLVPQHLAGLRVAVGHGLPEQVLVLFRVAE